MVQLLLITLNDGSPTRYQRFEKDIPGGSERSVPDVTVTAVEESDFLEQKMRKDY